MGKESIKTIQRLSVKGRLDGDYIYVDDKRFLLQDIIKKYNGYFITMDLSDERELEEVVDGDKV